MTEKDVITLIEARLWVSMSVADVIAMHQA